MSSSKIITEPRAIEIVFTDHELTVQLMDGRVVSTPLAWFPRLLHANALQRANWELVGDGEGIHWPELDDDISVEGLIFGIKPGR